MKTNEGQTGLDLRELGLTEACILNFDLPKSKHVSFIELCKKAKVIYRFGTKEEPNYFTAYEYTCENEGDEGTKWYILLNEYQSKKDFICWAYFEEDVKKLFHALIFQCICATAQAA